MFVSFGGVCSILFCSSDFGMFRQHSDRRKAFFPVGVLDVDVACTTEEVANTGNNA